MTDVDYVVWDFDDVLNANIIDGRFIWADHFEHDPLRTLFIENEMGFGARVEARLGLR